MNLIDIHCHLLPGTDDGPSDVESAVKLAMAQIEAGVERVVATPHVSARFENRGNDIHRSIDRFRETLSDRGVPLAIECGAEISAPVALELPDKELELMRLGGGDWLLIEPPSSAGAVVLRLMIQAIQRRGHRVLLAHPERSRALMADPDVLTSLLAEGVRTQVTASALEGRFGTDAQRFSRDLFQRGQVHTVASDAHDCRNRPPGLEGPLQAAGLSDRIEEFCSANPSAILGSSA